MGIRRVIPSLGIFSLKDIQNIKEIYITIYNFRTKDDLALEVIKIYLKEKQAKPFILETRKGYHVVFYKKFDTKMWELDAKNCYQNYLYKYCLVQNDRDYIMQNATNHILTNITLNPNQLGLVYHPEKIFNEQLLGL